jgi:outer membrane protein assembly factor BamB/plastocyanin
VYSNLSKVVFSLGIVLMVAAITSIYITMVAVQGQGNQKSSSGTNGAGSGSQTSAPANAGGSSQKQNTTTKGQNRQGGSGVTITIPQGASSQKGPWYQPANAQASPNSKVTWNNKDGIVHTATADDNSFDTGNIQPGSSSSAAINGQGKIAYHCTIHPWMKGTITVSGAGGGVGASQSGNQTQNATPNMSNTNNSNNITQVNSGRQTNQTNQAGNQSGPQAKNQSASSSAQQGNSQSNNTQGQGQQPKSNINTEGFPFRTHSTAFKLLPHSTKNELGTEYKNKDNWMEVNHDKFGSRTSIQTSINKSNVNQLQVKWILNTDFPVENSPLIIGDRGYAQDNAMRVIAFDLNSGINLWKFDPGVADKQTQSIPRGVFSHGIAFDKGVIFAPTGANGTVVALNASDGKLLWQSAAIGDPSRGYRLPSPPIVWGDYVIAGSALGDEPPFGPAAKGSITAFNRTNGERIWNISTVTGQWVQGKAAEKNGGGTVWSGGSLDPMTGIIYVPTGNAAPDFDAKTRPPPNPYTNSIIAIDIRTGNVLWHTRTTIYNTHDWDTAWGTSFANITTSDGLLKKIVVGQNKLGQAFALDASNGRVIWNKTLGVQYQINADPQLFGSGIVWPGTQYGVEAYNANDGNMTYFSVSNMGFNYFKQKSGTSGHLVPAFDAIENGLGNGTITAVDLKTGVIKWTYPTKYPTWVSPLVSGGVVFSGHITGTGYPYEYNTFGAPTNTPLIPSGIILALDKNSGKKLWEFNVGSPIGIGGPSIGHGLLLVPTGSPAEIESNKGGYIVAFAPPSTSNSSQQFDIQNIGNSSQVIGRNPQNVTSFLSEPGYSNKGNITKEDNASSLKG